MGLGNSNEEYGHTRSTNIEQLEYDKELQAKRIVEVPSNMQFRGDYGSSTDGLPDYIGYSAMGLGEGSNYWLLKKFTYDTNRQCTKIQCCTNSNWTARTTATYS